MSKGPTARTIARRLAAERTHNAKTIAQLKERPSPMRELGEAAAAYLHEFGSDGYTLLDFVDFVRAQTCWVLPSGKVRSRKLAGDGQPDVSQLRARVKRLLIRLTPTTKGE